MSMRTRFDLNALFLLFPFVLLVLPGAAPAADAQVQPELAKRYFEEATKLCERDAGRLWGVSLCGPMVIFDQATGTRATSQPEPEGPLPRFPAYADGPVSWGGVMWFAYPLSMLAQTDADARQQNMLHGLFHRIQPDLPFTKGNSDGSNEHLDTLEGRVWIQLEWRALRRAIESSGNDRAEAIADALAFRGERRRRFPGAADNERRDEIREGLASYTGIAVWANSPADARRAAASALAGSEGQPSFVGNFEAASGPAYGVLLDDLLPQWRRQLRGVSDLGDLLGSAINRPPATDVAVAAVRHDGAALRTAEEARDRAQQVRVAELRQRFVDGPVLTMLAGGRWTSDTTGSVGIPGVGTVLFRNFTLSAQWGRFDANSGVLRAADGATLSVPVAGPLEGTILKGDGWSATLNAGWVVRPAAREGSFAIVRANDGSAKDRELITAILGRWEEAWNTHDMTAFAELFHEDGVWVLWTGDVWTGRRRIEEGHAAVHKTIFRNSIQREHLEELTFVGPDAAIVRFCSVLTGSEQSPNQPIRSRKFVVVTKRQGVWKMSWGQNTRLRDDVPDSECFAKLRKPVP
jgi:uncharacterized protein (TIGR02246 family)